MLRIRTTKTASNNIAVQVVFRKNQKTKIVKHIGSAKNKEELKTLAELAEQYIATKSGAMRLFPKDENHHLITIENLKFTNYYHNLAYEFLSYFYELNGFNKLNNSLLKDLSIIRIIEPTSKIKSIELIKEYFGIKYAKNTTYRGLRKFNLIKADIEKTAIQYAKNNLNFNFTVVFYDITTLYFETFKDDEIRKCGFSKDNKSNQPQILIALVVNNDGYPLAVDIFEGNKFEGHTIIPVMLKLKQKYNINHFTVVADAAMLSFNNIKELENNGLNYIVGARLSNLSLTLLKKISLSINKQEKVYFKTQTPHGILISDYSIKRASKDKSDRTKQIRKAEFQINNQTVTKRSRFIQETTKSIYELNKELIKKDELLDGLKGYYTNLKNTKTDLIISRYKDLWHVEKAFRIAKSDLRARPIFHHKKEKIEAHILIVFVSLCLSKSIELLTGFSIKKVKNEVWKILDGEFKDTLTDKKFIKRVDFSQNETIKSLLKIINVSTY